MVWPCPLPVDAYIAAGRRVEVPRPGCPLCAGPLVLWAGYWRHVRAAGRCRKIFVPRLRGGGCGVRPAAARAGVPHTTARGWVRRFSARGGELGTAFAALAVELGGDAVRPPAEAARFALAGIKAAFGVAAGLPGWLAVGVWRFASSVSGGRLIAANTGSPFLVAGTRRFMPPVPP